MIVERLLRIALAGSAWVLYLLLALSVVSLAAMVERWLFFRRHTDDSDALRRRLSPPLRSGDFDEAEKILRKSPAIEARVLVDALKWRDGGAEAVSDAIDSEVSAARKELERGTALLGTLGNNAPFVGLLGTVLGVIEAFHHLGDGANKAAMSNVMSGIAEALVATGVGLFVALPAVVAYNLVQKRIGDIESAAAAMGKLVTAALKTHHARPSAAERDDANGEDEDEDAQELAHAPVNGVVTAKAARA
ncbi:MotA/TolQ/ExbB proton channel family protein [Minicystis rosea]|nr:MotA/TolQ/ExbB proton channel family protein [Minicystis rosea]